MKKKEQSIQLIILIAMLMSGYKAYALDFDPYVKVEASGLDVQVADVRFTPLVVKGGVGVFLWPGIGLEVQGGLTEKENKDSGSGVFAEVSGYKSIALRLQSPSEDEMRAFATLGYSEFTMETYQKSPSTIYLSENLGSGEASIGFEKQISFFPRLSYALAYEYVFDDDLVSIRAINFSYRYAFGNQ